MKSSSYSPRALLLLAGGTLLLAGAVAYRLLGGSSAGTTTSPTGKTLDFPLFSDSQLTTLPDVPGLSARIAAEPDFARWLLSMLASLGADTDGSGDKLVSIMSEESAFKPSARNPVSNTVGFLQWMPKYFPNFFDAPIPTVDEVQQMSGIDQLTLVYQTVRKLPAYLTDPAMQGWGSHIGSPDSTVLASQGDVAYTQNAGYDAAKKGFITAGDVRSAVLRPLSVAAKKPRLGPDGQAVTTPNA